MKEFIIEALKVIKKQDAKFHTLYNMGVDLIDFYSECETQLMVALSKLIGKDEGRTLDWISWWLYEDVDKIIYDNGGETNVTEINDFVEFLITC